MTIPAVDGEMRMGKLEMFDDDEWKVQYELPDTHPDVDRRKSSFYISHSVCYPTLTIQLSDLSYSAFHTIAGFHLSLYSAFHIITITVL